MENADGKELDTDRETEREREMSAVDDEMNHFSIST